MNSKKNDADAPRSPGGGATLVVKPTAILAENAQEEDLGHKPSVLENHGYTLGRTIGSGSYATVKVARSERHECDAAVKIVSKFQSPADYLRKFLPREIEVVKGLTYQNLVRFLQVIETTHRDIKCENLLMYTKYNIKLSDVGFARGYMKPKNGVSPLSETFGGTYAYASPEILRGVPYQPQLSGIWSMGIVLHAIVFGRLPFDDTNHNQLLRQVQAKVTFPKEPRVSTACRSLITRILASARRRLKITAILHGRWFILTSDVTRSPSSEDSLDSVATSSRNDSLEQTSVIQLPLTKEVLRAATSKPRPDGGNTTDEEQPIRSLKPTEPHIF